MKTLLTILFFLSGIVSADAQFFTPIKTPIAYDNLKIAKLTPPSDTFPPTLADTGRWAIVGDRSFKVFNRGGVAKWDTLRGGSGGGVSYSQGRGIKIAGETIQSTYPVITTAAALRALVPAAGEVYRATLNNIPNDWLPDYADVSSPDDGRMILIGPAGVRFKRVIDDHINVKWFGATGDGVTDDHAAIQACTDWSIAHMGETRTVRFPRGVYKITQPITLYKWNGTNYEFFSINIEGERVGNFTRTDYSTVIKPTFSDKNAIEFELAKTSRISGLYISGPADGAFSWDQKTFVGIPFETFMQGLSRDTRHSAQAGISIDPYTQSIGSKPADSYPGRDAWYRGPGSTGGSSDVTVEDCRIYGFTIGVGISLNGVTRNAEVIKVLHSSIGYAKVAVASGQDQTKNNIVRDLICWDYVHTVFDNNTYGEGVGTNPMVDGVNIAGHVNRLANIVDYGRYGSYMTHVFAEGMFRVGKIVSQAPSVIEKYQFDFSTSEGADMPTPDNFLQAENLTLRSGQMRIYDNTDKRIHILGGNNLVFESCTFPNLPIVKNYNQAGNVTPASFYNCNLNIAGGTVGTRMLNVQRGTGEKNTILGFPLTIKSSANVSFGEPVADYNDPNSESLIDLENTATVTVNKSNYTATVNVAFPQIAAIRVGDYLRSENEVLGRVTANNGTIVTLSQVPISLSTGSYPIYLSYVRKVQTPFVGDVELGSLVITNVETFAGYPEVGDRIENPMFGLYRGFSGTDAAVGTYITAVDAGAKTVTVNFGPVGTGTSIDFAMGDPEYTIQNRLTPELKAADNLPNVIFKGTIWVVKGNGGSPDKAWKFTRSGYLNAAGVSGAVHQAAWEEITDFTPADITWSRIDPNNVKAIGATSHSIAQVESIYPGTVASYRTLGDDGVGGVFQSNPDELVIGGSSNHPTSLAANGTKRLQLLAGGGMKFLEYTAADTGYAAFTPSGDLIRRSASDSIKFNTVGGGIDLIKNVVGKTVNFKSLIFTGITPTENPNDFTIDLSGITAGCSTCVTLTGNQTITGTKSFTGSTTLFNDIEASNVKTAGSFWSTKSSGHAIYLDGGADIYTVGPSFFRNDVNIKHVVGQASATPTYTILFGLGTGAACTITGSDLGGKISLTTGTGVSIGAGQLLLTITFNSVYGANPAVTLTPSSVNTSSLGVSYVQSASTSAFYLGVAGTPASSTTYTWDYTVVGVAP